jgi:hypothetical protein
LQTGRVKRFRKINKNLASKSSKFVKKAFKFAPDCGIILTSNNLRAIVKTTFAKRTRVLLSREEKIMNGEIELLRAETVIFPMTPREREVSEVTSIKIEETIVTEDQTVEMKIRFARLKKSLRKGSKSIL